jgi:hypothetical protein
MAQGSAWAIAAAAGLAQIPGLSTTGTVVALVVFVLLAGVSLAGPVVDELVGGPRAQPELDEMKSWSSTHNSAVMAVLFLVFGVVVIRKGRAPISA